MTDDETPAEGTPRPEEDSSAKHSRLATWLRRGAIVVVGLFVAMQLVPYGWHHSNPPVEQDAPWPDERSAAIARESCYSCHINETDWPMYSYVAPMSWLARRDVDSGRDRLNFSRWERDAARAEDAADAVRDGEMPPAQYTLIHRGAQLTDEEAAILVAALESMDRGRAGNEGSGTSGTGGDDDD